MNKIIPCLALGLLSQGCVGVGVLKTHTETVRDPVVPDSARPASVFSRELSKTTNSVIYTSEWLETHWGKPASITHAGLDEVWTYKFGAIWEGVMPIIVIPLPIVLPVGRE